MGLLVVVSSMTYWFYASALDTRRRETETARRLRLVRVTLDRVAEEIRQSSMIAAGGRVGIRGEPERIWLSTLRVPTKDLLPGSARPPEEQRPQTDLIKVEYGIARHPDIQHEDGYELALGLKRVEIGVPRRDSSETGEAFEDQRPDEVIGGQFDQAGGEGEEAAAGDEELSDEELTDEELFGDEDTGDADLGPDVNWEELYAPEIKYIRFCYFDGARWWNDWEINGEAALPQAVQVTIGFEEHPPYGEGLDGFEEEKFCECMNEDPTDCEPPPPDQYTAVVRIQQADPLFRSRISRETQSLMDDLGGGEESDEEAVEP